MKSIENNKGPLNDLIVADFSQLAQGPWATQMLGDMGAEVIKIEPLKGDWMRHFSYGNLYPNGESISFVSFNRNKKSIALNLKEKSDLDIAKSIIAQADILVENFRPGVMERLGLGYEEISKLNPGLVYCSSSGYGSSGPYVKRPGQDLLAQAVSGTATLNGKKDDIPIVTAVGQADLLTSLFLVQAILAAINSREKTGMGQKIEANLLSSIIGFHVQEITAYLHVDTCPERSESGIPNPWLGAPYGLYRTKDSFLAIGMNPVRKLAKAMGFDKYDLPEYESNNIIENRDLIRKDFEEVFVTKTTDEWLETLLEYDVWCSQVNTLGEMVNDPQVLHNGMIMSYDHPSIGVVKTTGFPIQFSGTPQKIYRPSPLLDQHREEIIKSFCKDNDNKNQKWNNE